MEKNNCLPENHHSYCLYDDEQVKPDCPIQHTHAYWIGLRVDCRKCEVYQKWQRVHKKELEALRSADL